MASGRQDLPSLDIPSRRVPIRPRDLAHFTQGSMESPTRAGRLSTAARIQEMELPSPAGIQQDVEPEF